MPEEQRTTAPYQPETRHYCHGHRPQIPWAMHLKAYEVYAHIHGPQKALIEGGCLRADVGADSTSASCWPFSTLPRIPRRSGRTALQKRTGSVWIEWAVHRSGLYVYAVLPAALTASRATFIAH